MGATDVFVRDLTTLAATNPSAFASFLDALRDGLFAPPPGPYASAARSAAWEIGKLSEAYCRGVDGLNTWSWDQQGEVEPDLPLFAVAAE
jgi:hypothetical protein